MSRRVEVEAPVSWRGRSGDQTGLAIERAFIFGVPKSGP
jgi:hypothetical protein